MKKILIVDDSPQNIKILNNILKTDYKISAVISGQDCLDLAQKEPHPDLILLDIMMPEMSGYDVIKELKKNKKTKNIPVIFVTAKNEIDDKLDGYEMGAVQYITKPIDPNLVKEIVSKHIL